MRIATSKALCLLLLLSAAPLAAQIDSATLVGTVRDAQGAVIPNAGVAALRVATNETLTTSTNASGDYVIGPLRVGEYEVRASLAGFKTEVRKGLVLEVGRTVRLDISLAVGQLTETVEVVAQVPLLDSENAASSNIIDNRKLEALPLAGRDFTSLASLIPGVAPLRGTALLGETLRFNVRGLRSTDNVMHIDGTMFSQGNGWTTFRPNMDALQEYQIITGLYGAQYGTRPGGQFVATTKSGTNQVHGNAFWHVTNDNFNARNFFEARKNESKRNQFGATFGGPIVLPKLFDGRDKAWFFLAYQKETVRRFLPLTGIMPTANEKQGIFAAAVRDPLTGQPFPGNAIPAARIHPTSQKFLGYWLEPNTVGPLNYTSPNSVAAYDTPQYIAKVDFNLSANDRWSARYARNNEPDLAININPIFSSVRPIVTWSQSATNTHTFSSRVVNVASGHVFRRVFDQRLERPKPEVPPTLGIPELLVNPIDRTGVPLVSLTNYTGVGDLGIGISVFGNWQVRDNLSVQAGSHYLQMGGEFRKHIAMYNFANRASFGFLARYTGNAFADFLLGNPSTSVIGGENQRGALAQNSVYTYIQDDWKISPKVTLNLGLRYELRLPWKDKRGFSSNFDTVAGKVTPDPAPMELKPWETGRFPANYPLMEWAKTGFMPRVGVAYRLDGKTVLRGGYGMYGNEPDISALQSFGDNPRPQNVRRTYNADATRPTLSFSNPFPGQGVVSTPTLAGFETPLPLNVTHQWGFSIQRQVRNSLLLELGYAGSRSTHLMHVVSWNDAVPGTGNRQARRPYPALQAVNMAFGSGDAWYQGMEVKVEKRRAADGLNLGVAFTWSKSIDTVAGRLGVAGEPSVRSRNMSLALNKALSDSYIPRRLAINADYELPFGRGKALANSGWLEKIAGGWSLLSIAVIQDGAWITATVPGDPLDTGSTASQRPDALRTPNLPDGERTRLRWFDTAALVRPAEVRYGNAGRSIIDTPALINFDFAVHRSFRVREGHAIVFRFESFNAPNHTNFGFPGTSIGTAAIGVIGSARDPRTLQLGLKYNF